MAEKTYTTIQGDTWDYISFKVYGDERYMGELMQKNMQHIDCVVFPANVQLIVPELQISDDETAPDWRQINE